MRLVLALFCCGICSLFCREELNWSHKQPSFLSSSTETHTHTHTHTHVHAQYKLGLCWARPTWLFSFLTLTFLIVVELVGFSREKLRVPTLVFLWNCSSFDLLSFPQSPLTYSLSQFLISSTLCYLCRSYFSHLWLRRFSMPVSWCVTGMKSQGLVLRFEHRCSSRNWLKCVHIFKMILKASSYTSLRVRHVATPCFYRCPEQT